MGRQTLDYTKKKFFLELTDDEGKLLKDGGNADGHWLHHDPSKTVRVNGKLLGVRKALFAYRTGTSAYDMVNKYLYPNCGMAECVRNDHQDVLTHDEWMIRKGSNRTAKRKVVARKGTFARDFEERYAGKPLGEHWADQMITEMQTLYGRYYSDDEWMMWRDTFESEMRAAVAGKDVDIFYSGRTGFLSTLAMRASEEVAERVYTRAVAREFLVHGKNGIPAMLNAFNAEIFTTNERIGIERALIEWGYTPERGSNG